MDAAALHQTPLHRLLHWQATTPAQIFLRQAHADGWRSFTWSEVYAEVTQIAAGLERLGILPGERVAILSRNCAHWLLADLAIWAAGAVSVPLYQNQQAQTSRYILEHCGAKAIFCGRLDRWDNLDAALPPGICRLSFPYADSPSAAISWAELGQGPALNLSADTLPKLEQVATIIYTSGTTAMPKGVVHSFGGMAQAAYGFCHTFNFSSADRMLSYLPLSHVAERILVEMIGIYSSTQIYFAESLEVLTATMREVKPTAFFSVPRLWQRFQQMILAEIPAAQLEQQLQVSRSAPALKERVRALLGLDAAHAIGSGAAPLAPALLDWYRRLGIEIREGYGLTESFAYATTNRPGQIKLGTVGQAQLGAEITIDPSGEILVHSKAMMLGYFEDPTATAQVLTPAGLRTGDIGTLDESGYLTITGRVKEIFKTDTGKYIAPAPLEHRLQAESSHIDQLCIVGQSRRGPVALCVLSPSARECADSELRRDFVALLARVNPLLEKHERIERCILVHADWTVAGGMLTPTLKIKRHVIEQHYQEMITRAVAETEIVSFANHLDVKPPQIA